MHQLRLFSSYALYSLAYLSALICHTHSGKRLVVLWYQIIMDKSKLAHGIMHTSYFCEVANDVYYQGQSKTTSLLVLFRWGKVANPRSSQTPP